MIQVDIYLDKETLPPAMDDSELVRFKQNLKAPGTMKKQETIDAWVEENWLEKYKKMAVDPNKLDIATFAFNFNKTETKCLINLERKNGEILKVFYDELKSYVLKVSQEEEIEIEEEDLVDDEFLKFVSIRWIGFNIRNFDLDILWKNAIKYKLYNLARLIPRKKYDTNVVDLMEVFNGSRSHEFISQKAVCEFLEIDGKPDDIDGSQVYDYWMAGQHDKIAEYNIFDVDTVIKMTELLVDFKS